MDEVCVNMRSGSAGQLQPVSFNALSPSVRWPSLANTVPPGGPGEINHRPDSNTVAVDVLIRAKAVAEVPPARRGRNDVSLWTVARIQKMSVKCLLLVHFPLPVPPDCLCQDELTAPRLDFSLSFLKQTPFVVKDRKYICMYFFPRFSSAGNSPSAGSAFISQFVWRTVQGEDQRWSPTMTGDIEWEGLGCNETVPWSLADRRKLIVSTEIIWNRCRFFKNH